MIFPYNLSHRSSCSNSSPDFLVVFCDVFSGNSCWISFVNICIMPQINPWPFPYEYFKFMIHKSYSVWFFIASATNRVFNLCIQSNNVEYVWDCGSSAMSECCIYWQQVGLILPVGGSVISSLSVICCRLRIKYWFKNISLKYLETIYRLCICFEIGY
jgi:hypothetical protein